MTVREIDFVDPPKELKAAIKPKEITVMIFVLVVIADRRYGL